MKKIISLILFSVILVSVMFLNSCSYLEELDTIFDLGHYPKNIFPEGYTGGFGIEPGSSAEYYWVETTEELIEAINLLKSHGSTFDSDDLYIYEGDMFDIKYCFSFGGSYKYDKEKVEYGENPYDRWASNVSIYTFAFCEDVTIEEISYSLIKYFNCYLIYVNEDYKTMVNNIGIDNLTFSDWEKDEFGLCHYRISYCDETMFNFDSCFFDDKEIKITSDSIVDFVTNGRFITLVENNGSEGAK